MMSLPLFLLPLFLLPLFLFPLFLLPLLPLPFPLPLPPFPFPLPPWFIVEFVADGVPLLALAVELRQAAGASVEFAALDVALSIELAALAVILAQLVNVAFVLVAIEWPRLIAGHGAISKVR